MGDYLKPEPDDPEKCVHVLVFLLVWGHISVQTLICPHKSLKCQLWFLFEFSGSECEVLWSGETAVCVWCRHNEHPSWTRSLIYEVCRTTSCFLWIKRTHMNTCECVCVGQRGSVCASRLNELKDFRWGLSVCVFTSETDSDVSVRRFMVRLRSGSL